MCACLPRLSRIDHCRCAGRTGAEAEGEGGRERVRQGRRRQGRRQGVRQAGSEAGKEAARECLLCSSMVDSKGRSGME